MVSTLAIPAVTCALCGLRAGNHPLTQRFDETEQTFCCLGCLNVYAVLRESGVLAAGQNPRETELFQRSLALGLISNPTPTNNSRTKTAAPPALSLPTDAPTQEALFQVAGMWCGSCAWLIEHALRQERGVVTAEAFFTSDLVKVRYCPQVLPPERLRERISTLGYQASAYTGENEQGEAERRDLLLRLGIAGFLWMNLMTLSMALYVSFFEPIALSIGNYLPFVLWALATPVVFYCAWPILRLAAYGLREGTVRMETLLSLGILAAYGYSVVQTLRSDPHIYFDTVAAIVTFVLAGKLIERGAKERTAQAVTLLYRLMPKKVRLWASAGEGERERFVAIDALQSGDAFIVKAGERIPADGVVISGTSHADEALLTGESVPVAKQPGSAVVAGSLNTGGVLQIAATRIGKDTTLAHIIQLVEHALSSHTALERTVDRIARYFVPSVMVIALLTFGICWLGGFTTAGEALLRGITVLVIACPCALGLATPLALTAAIGEAARRGILISDSRVLETIRQLDVVIFDKTGTVTDGDFALLDYACLADDDFTQTCLPLLAAVERFSEHPLGRALVKAAEASGVAIGKAQAVTIEKGAGIIGEVNGKRVFIGNRSLVTRARVMHEAVSQQAVAQETITQETVTIDAAIEARALAWESSGHTVAFFGWDGVLRGLLAFGDRLKPEARAVIEQLHARGVQTLLVSGDAPATVHHVAATLGIADVHASALPADKVRVIADLQAQGKVVAFIGDGINDAPALAQADLGLTLASGADIAMRASAVVLMTNSLEKVHETFALAQRTWRIVRQNLFWAFIYNVLSISLAVTGLLNPLLAAAAMLLSSFSVVANSRRISQTRTQ